MAEMPPAAFSPRREQQARTFFDTAASLFGVLGLRDAERSIRHYRDGTGADIHLTEQDTARHPLIDLGMRTNRNRFETRSLLGRVDAPYRKKLVGLKDGESIDFEDTWSRDFNFEPNLKDLPRYPRKLWEDTGLLTNPNTYLTFGRFGVNSIFKTSARRSGNDLIASSTVTHSLDPRDARIDFNPDQPGSGPARILERVGQAKPFNFRWSRTQPMNARVRYEPDGSLTLKGATWGPLQ